MQVLHIHPRAKLLGHIFDFKCYGTFMSYMCAFKVLETWWGAHILTLCFSSLVFLGFTSHCVVHLIERSYLKTENCQPNVTEF